MCKRVAFILGQRGHLLEKHAGELHYILNAFRNLKKKSFCLEHNLHIVIGMLESIN